MKFGRIFQFLFAACVLGATASASTIFNFDGDNPGTATTFTDTVDGLSATFSSPDDPGGFVVYPSIFETLTGNVLGDPGPAGANDIPLDIAFSSNLTAVELDFATADFITPSPLTITAYENGQLVGTAVSTGQFLSGFDFPEGEIAFDGGVFDQLVISTTAPDFAVDNIAAIATPEPGSIPLLAFGFAAIAFCSFRARARRKSSV